MERMDSGDVEGEGDLEINERMKERMSWKERMGNNQVVWDKEVGKE